MTVVFTETWTASNGSAWPAAWSTEARNTIQSNQGQFSAPIFSGTSAYAALSPTLADCEIVVSFIPDTTAVSASTSFTVALRADGAGTVGSSYPPTTGVAANIVSSGTSTLQRIVSGTTTFTSSGTAQSAWVAATTYMIRFRVVGTHCQMRWWDASGSEPSTWTFDVTNASIPTGAGSVRLGWAGSGSTVRFMNVDNLTVDDLAVPTLISIDDPAAATDALTTQAAVGVLGDAAAGVEAVTVAAAVPLAEVGTGTPALTVVAATSLAQAATGIDAVTVKVTVPLAETSTGTDALASAVVDPDVAQQADIDSLKASRTTDEADISSLKSSRTTDEADIASLKSSRTTDEADISSLKSSRTTDESAISSLQSSRTTDEAAISSLQSSRTTDESNISGLQSSRTTDEAAISSLQSSRTTDESNISNLQSRVTALESSGATAADKATVVNVKDHGAVGDGSTDDAAAINAAVDYARSLGFLYRTSSDDYENHDHRGAVLYFPSGTYVLNSPIILPRSGLYRSNTVGLVGQSMDSSRIVAGSSFPTGRALIEWAQSPIVPDGRVRDQVLDNLTLVPKNAVGCKAIYFQLQTARSSYNLGNVNNLDSVYGLRMSNLIVYGSNVYHDVLIRLEGRIDYSWIRNIYMDTDPGTAYNTKLLQFDDLTMYDSSMLPYYMFDFPGFNFGTIDTLGQGFRGGGGSLLWGRINASEVTGIQSGLGSINTNSNVYIRDGAVLDCHSWTSEGQAEDGVFKFENCSGVHLRDFGLGTTEGATVANPGYGLKLLNVNHSKFENRQGAHGSPAFSDYHSQVVYVDSACSDIQFVNWAGSGPFETEWFVDPAAQAIDVDYYDSFTGKRYNVQRRGAPTSANVVGTNLLLTGHPTPTGALGTAALAKDTWHLVPLKLGRGTKVSALKVPVATAASGGTAAGIFGLFTSANDGSRPNARFTDLSSYGTVNLAATGAASVTTTGLVLPAGDHWLGFAWSGTATTAPVVTVVPGTHPTVASTSVGVDATAYTLSVSGATVPATVSPTGTTTAGVAVYGTLA